MALVGWSEFIVTKDQLWLLMGISLMAGVGGVTVLDFVIQLFKKGGLHITIGGDDKK